MQYRGITGILIALGLVFLVPMTLVALPDHRDQQPRGDQVGRALRLMAYRYYAQRAPVGPIPTVPLVPMSTESQREDAREPARQVRKKRRRLLSEETPEIPLATPEEAPSPEPDTSQAQEEKQLRAQQQEVRRERARNAREEKAAAERKEERRLKEKEKAQQEAEEKKREQKAARLAEQKKEDEKEKEKESEADSQERRPIPVLSERDLDLLARAVYAEARGEPYVGQVAVAAVILNRMTDRHFPKTIPAIIFQPRAFEAVADGQIWMEPNDVSRRAVADALKGWDPAGHALYYYNPGRATSQWIRTRTQVKKIGKHVFCR